MMRKIPVTLVAAACLFAGSASANYTIDLIWANNSSATLTFPSTGAINNSNTDGCGGNNAGQTGYCVQVVLTATDSWAAAQTTLGWSTDSGVSAAFIPSASWAKFGNTANPLSGSSVTPNNVNALAPSGDCVLVNCSEVGSFGGVSLSNFAAGTYVIGSLVFDLSGAVAGTHTFENFFRSGVDNVAKFTKAGLTIQPSQLNPGTLVINAIPEPGTASLLGLGIVGLVLAGRRRNR